MPNDIVRERKSYDVVQMAKVKKKKKRLQEQWNSGNRKDNNVFDIKKHSILVFLSSILLI